MSDLKQDALDYHLNPIPGKLATKLTKPTETQRDLSLAYSPGVAEPCREIEKNPEDAYKYTGKGNLVAVITDGTAVLGLGDIGALAGKPVMEGKGVLFKRFADIDVFDIEVNADSPEDFIKTVENIADTFGGINLEDIAAPHCFEIEEKLIEKLDIPVFHDDQHGTAIVISAGIVNALRLRKKNIADCKIVCLGAGAAGIASMNMLINLGAKKEKIFMLGRGGVLRTSLKTVDERRAPFINDSGAETLDDAIQDADIFIGVSGPNLFSANQLKKMAPNPIIFALANPDPEIKPELAWETRDDIIMATGRSDYPNQVNNVLCFPFLFKGALSVRAKTINIEMKIAAVEAIASIARMDVPDSVKKIHNDPNLAFGENYVIPSPFDPRLIDVVPEAVADAARKSGVARI